MALPDKLEYFFPQGCEADLFFQAQFTGGFECRVYTVLVIVFKAGNGFGHYVII